MKVIESEEWIETFTIDTILYSKTWSPETPIATLLFIHGTGEHISRYQEMFTFFAQNGIKVVGFDQRGYGRTAQHSGNFYSEGLEKTMEDILYMSKETRQDGLKHFIMGHSMGGIIVLEFARRYPQEIDGVIASAPAVVPGDEVKPNRIQLFLVWLCMIIWPTLVMSTYMQTTTLTRNTELKENHDIDPLNHGYMAIRLASDLLELSPKLMENAHELQVPLLITHGTADKITCPQGSLEFFDRVRMEDKKFIEYDGYYHELHNEPSPFREKVFQDYVDWILAHL